MRLLHWFQNDLRVNHNPAFANIQSAESLLCVYLMPRPRPWCNLAGLGPQRDRFLRESLTDLTEQLAAHGQNLMVLEGSPELVLPYLINRFGITAVSTQHNAGYYERQTRQHLEENLPVPLTVYPGNSLFETTDLPFELDAMPGVFSPFRRKVESLNVPAPSPCPEQLPPPPAAAFDRLPPAECDRHPALPLPGGRSAGIRRLQQFLFDEQSVLSYKETRNDLDPLRGSSTLSPWLANGALSAREVAHALFRFEREYRQNESTYWLYFELLWREFFYWRAVLDDRALFRLNGSGKKILTQTFDPRQFARWCAGDTDYPLVNALMRQLNATGWMSNRGRQIAASCLVNELDLDWRFGAAYFEQQLIDFDVASNYGNWQYIAGVGSDPKGGRRFDLAWQAEQHDPEGVFTAKWQGKRPAQPLYVTDAADWPIEGKP